MVGLSAVINVANIVMGLVTKIRIDGQHQMLIPYNEVPKEEHKMNEICLLLVDIFLFEFRYFS